MPWVKLDDGFADHPKIEKAGPLASWLHVVALCYAARHLTDGHIPAAKARRLIDARGVQKLIDRLIEVELWEHDGDDYLIHDYLDWQPAAAEVEAKRDKDRSRKAKGRNSQERDAHTGRMSARNPHGQDPEPPPPTPEPVRTESARNPQNVTPVPSRTRPLTTNGCRDSHVSPIPDDDGTNDGTPPDLDQVATEIARARSKRLGGGHNPVWIRTTAARLNRAVIAEAISHGHTDPAELDQILDGNRHDPPNMHPAIAANRPACETCDGMRHLEAGDGTVTPCPHCTSVLT